MTLIEFKPQESPTGGSFLLDVRKATKELHNYRYTEEDEIGAGGLKTKFRVNLDAIRTLKAIEGESRLASPEEQHILARYVGWGGMPQAFDPNQESWRKEYGELKELLTPDEYTSARASTPNAHYTPVMVVTEMLKALERFGFSKGSLLEPAMGVGNFFSALPVSMRGARLYGVELDSLSGRISKQLYQKADIRIQGFETSIHPDNFFDAAAGNVPFGDYKLYDPRYDRYHLNIHDYFLAKALDKVRPGGIVAFITSKGTLDKKNPSFRRYLSERAELIGAVRLPNTAFKDNANTEVTSDILFLQKRERMSVVEPDWLHLGLTKDGVPVNQYYLNHPEMMLGTMVFDTRLFGEESHYTSMVMPKGVDWTGHFQYAMSTLKADMGGMGLKAAREKEEWLPADPNVKNYTFALVNSSILYRENAFMNPVDLKPGVVERVKGMMELRTVTRSLIQLQTEGCTQEELNTGQQRLTRVYDSFFRKYGSVNSKPNSLAFRDDADYPLLCSLEVIDGEKNIRKADIFYKQTIRPHIEITEVDTAVEALTVSLNVRGRVDIPYMSKLFGNVDIMEVGTDTEEKSAEWKRNPYHELTRELQGTIFLNPEKWNQEKPEEGWETADEYLSGNVRHKLNQARTFVEGYPDIFQGNVAALEQVQPQDLEASEIDVRLGATWVEPSDIEKFLYETLDTPSYCKNRGRGGKTINIRYNQLTGQWCVENKTMAGYSVLVSQSFGTKCMDAYTIVEETLNLKSAMIRDPIENAEGKTSWVINKNETIAVREKQDLLKDAFKNWIFQDPERRVKYVAYYNQTFNNLRLRQFDGSHLTFPGMNPDILLRPHQVNAIARVLYGGSTLLAHCVGAGKSFEMVASCMELKRLGLARKSVLVVPNHLTEQIGAEFLRLYPSANILVATRKDFEKQNRHRFVSRIATGDYDAVIIGHSSFEKIPISKERQERMITGQIKQVTEAIQEAMKERNESWSVKQMEKFKKGLETDLRQLLDESRKDDLVNFEELGVDNLFVDEAHAYKNCAVFSKMRNVAGISNTKAKKSMDMLLKCQYIQEVNNGRGVVFATGTPVSNSMTEMFVMQRYIQNDALVKSGLNHFDSWAAMYGEVVSSLELAPEGTGFRYRSRFSKFTNLPELMTMFRNMADIQTAEMLKLPVPMLKNNQYNLHASLPTPFTEDYVQAFSKRAEAIRNGQVNPTIDNMLKITTEGRLLGTDPRLISRDAEDDPASKINRCIENIITKYHDTHDIKGTQLVFCDVGTPNDDGRFSVYDDIRRKLVKSGIPEMEVCFIHDAKNEADREQLFMDMRSGTRRIILGSTAKMGTGTNIQSRLVALHHLDCPFRPSDIEQREGRILRQGNRNAEVEIFRYVTKNTFDSYLWQMVEQKQRFISQIMTGKSVSRSCEDVDETVLSFAEVKALATGNPLIREKMDLDNEISRLQILKAAYTNQRYSMQDGFTFIYPRRIRELEEECECVIKDIALRDMNRSDKFGIQLDGRFFDEREAAGELLQKMMRERCEKNGKEVQVGSFMGFNVLLRFNVFMNTYDAILHGNSRIVASLGSSSHGSMVRLENAANGCETRLSAMEKRLAEVQQNMVTAQDEYKKPFVHSEALAVKLARQSELNSILNLDKREGVLLDDEGEEKAASENQFDSEEAYENEITA